MPTFDTPEPIAISLELAVGDVCIAASERADTIVEVRPSDPSKKSDVAAAEQTRVDYTSGTLVIKAPKGWRHWSPWSGRESIDVRIDVPAGSRVRGTAAVAGLRATGRLGECRYRTGVGNLQVEEAGPLELRAGAGDVAVDVATSSAVIKTAGAVRIGRVDGSAAIKNSNGDTWIGEVTGEARVSAANGPIHIDLAQAGVAAKTANGGVRLGEVARGSIVAQSAFGAVEIGVRDGVAAWLDLETKFGTVHNDLDAARQAEAGEDVVEVRAHTAMGDITIYRSFASVTVRDEP